MFGHTRRRRNPTRSYGFRVIGPDGYVIGEELVVTDNYTTAREQAIYKLGARGVLVTGFGRVEETPYLTMQILSGRSFETAPAPQAAPMQSPVDYLAPKAPAAPAAAAASSYPAFELLHSGEVEVEAAGLPEKYAERVYRHKGTGIVVQALARKGPKREGLAHSVMRATGYGMFTEDGTLLLGRRGSFPRDYKRIEELFAWNYTGGRYETVPFSELMKLIETRIDQLASGLFSATPWEDEIETSARNV